MLARSGRLVAIVVVTLLAVPPVARAADESAAGERGGGMVVELLGWWATAGSLDTDYAYVDPTGSLSGGGEVQSLSYERKAVARVRAGWRLGEGGPVVSASFLEHEVVGHAETGLQPGRVGALLASPDFAIGRSLADSATDDSRARGTQVDVDLAWEAAAGHRARVELAAGLRLFRFERTTTVTYEATDFSGSDLLEIVRTSSDARGIGPKAAATFGYEVTRRVLFSAQLGLALPVGDIEAEGTDSAFVDGSFDRATEVTRRGTRRAFLQLDGDIGVEGGIARGLSASLSYRFSYWSGVAKGQRFVDDVSQNTTLPGEENVSIEGFALGLRYEF